MGDDIDTDRRLRRSTALKQYRFDPLHLELAGDRLRRRDMASFKNFNMQIFPEQAPEIPSRHWRIRVCGAKSFTEIFFTIPLIWHKLVSMA